MVWGQGECPARQEHGSQFWGQDQQDSVLEPCSSQINERAGWQVGDGRDQANRRGQMYMR